MDVGKATLVISSIFILVVIFNAAIYVAVKRRKTTGQIELLRKATQGARNPWGDETAKLEELSRRVAALRGDDETEENRLVLE